MRRNFVSIKTIQTAGLLLFFLLSLLVGFLSALFS